MTDGRIAEKADGRARHRRSEMTREKLILAAEKLFGEAGIDAVALRTVSEAAGQRNNTSVQYHFGDKLDLVKAIFEYRERQLQPVRALMLEQVRRENRLGDVKSLLRIIFEPAFELYMQEGNINHLRFYLVYTTQYRPRGILHPVDLGADHADTFRTAMDLLRRRLSFLEARRFDFRLETVGAMFLNAFIHFDANKERSSMTPRTLLEEVLEMMSLALCAPPWSHERAAEDAGGSAAAGV